MDSNHSKGKKMIFHRLPIETNYGGSRATYLKVELVNVQVTAFDVNASGNDESPLLLPAVQV